MPTAVPNRKYKDRLFLRIFREKEDLLSLYNAVNGSHYEDPDALEITTLEDVLYLGMKNDISFLIDSYMNLYEAQSTWNPNMPLRGLFYFSRLYSSYVERRNLDIYSRTLLKLPTPKYIVFYNGTTGEPETQTLRLSASFEKQTPSGQEPCLECVATVLNINHGHNMELMNQCRKLYEYSYLIQQIRKFLAAGFTLETSIDQAIDNCLQHNIMVDFLTKHREEARFMILTEYNEELHQKTLYNEGFEDGSKTGEERISRLIQLLIQENRLEDIKKISLDPEYRKKLLREFNL